jgi:hypothetical protein
VTNCKGHFFGYIKQVVKDMISCNENKAFIFNQPIFDKNMLLNVDVLWITSFATIKIMGVDPQKAKPRDFGVGIMHLSFHIKIIV